MRDVKLQFGTGYYYGVEQFFLYMKGYFYILSSGVIWVILNTILTNTHTFFFQT